MILQVFLKKLIHKFIFQKTITFFKFLLKKKLTNSFSKENYISLKKTITFYQFLLKKFNLQIVIFEEKLVWDLIFEMQWFYKFFLKKFDLQIFEEKLIWDLILENDLTNLIFEKKLEILKKSLIHKFIFQKKITFYRFSLKNKCFTNSWKQLHFTISS